jgi:hypothetical protein
VSRRRSQHPSVSVQPKAEKREAVCVALRTVLIRDDRDEIAQEILRYGDAGGWSLGFVTRRHLRCSYHAPGGQ